MEGFIAKSSYFFFRPYHFTMLSTIHIDDLAMDVATEVFACKKEHALRYCFRWDRFTERGLEPMSA